MEVLHWVLLAVIVCFAGVIRGCIGFGFSALVVALASIFLNPKMIVPMVAILEIAASIHMATSVYKQVKWQPLLYLLLGTLITTPIGVFLLVYLPVQDIRLMLSLLIFILSMLLLSGWQYHGRVGMLSFLAMGAFAGGCNGAAGIGGLPVATFLSSIKINMAQIRATLVLYFFAADIIFIIAVVVVEQFFVSANNDSLYSSSLLWLSALMLIPMTLGIQLGSKLFIKLNERTLKRAVIIFLALLSVVGIAKVVF